MLHLHVHISHFIVFFLPKGGGGQILVFLVGNTKRARGPNLEGSYVNSKSIPYMDSVFRWCFDIIYMNDFADVLRFIYYRSGNYF